MGINIVKMAILSRAIQIINAIPNKIPMTLSIEMEKNTHSHVERLKNRQVANAILGKEKKAGSILMPGSILMIL